MRILLHYCAHCQVTAFKFPFKMHIVMSFVYKLTALGFNKTANRCLVASGKGNSFALLCFFVCFRGVCVHIWGGEDYNVALYYPLLNIYYSGRLPVCPACTINLGGHRATNSFKFTNFLKKC